MNEVSTECNTVEKALFDYLLSVRDGNPTAKRPILASRPVLRAMSRTPNSTLVELLRHCISAFLSEVPANFEGWGPIAVSSSVLGFALAAHNVCAAREEKSGQALTYTTDLLATLPPPAGAQEVIARHAVVRGQAFESAEGASERTNAIRSLLYHSPLTALWALDASMPDLLTELAAELLPGWRREKNPGGGGSADEEWIDLLRIVLSDSRLARWVQHRWLLMEETRAACRNVGLMLEALRRRGDSRGFILEFYEAYDYFGAQTGEDGTRSWPILWAIGSLVRSRADHDMAIRINRYGNEYWLKFEPLVQIIIEERGVPRDYQHLTREFVGQLQSIRKWVTVGRNEGMTFGGVTFSAGYAD